MVTEKVFYTVRLFRKSSHGVLSKAIMSTIKGLSPSDVQYDGFPLRIAIVHARWNKKVVEALVAGVMSKLKERGVKESNIVLESVPGSYELPLACSKSVVFPANERLYSY